MLDFGAAKSERARVGSAVRGNEALAVFFDDYDPAKPNRSIDPDWGWLRKLRRCDPRPRVVRPDFNTRCSIFYNGRVWMMKRLWFHAFKGASGDVHEVVGVLRDGNTPNPDPTCRTRKNEAELGISPPHVYAYLSRLNPAFGRFGVALNFESCGGGRVSPFDTGGLVKHIRPVSEWEREAKRTGLKAFTWARRDLEAQLTGWPGLRWDHYVDAARPGDDGPHVPLKVRMEMPIWLKKHENDWQAWVWELRNPNKMAFGAGIFRWTCPPEVFPDLIDVGRSDPSLRSFITGIIPKYVPGGVSVLFDVCRDAA